ncbi:uncharacterized protein Z518_00786 [Rhinocladiella mackenziei CBS 650.93]|uniref:Zn(2)-C6 fungal-type domain-containing protein n=1 Tax=Rhinocladiella mackenziei CBS 650.93 TaxID=1442369 RepID=A0A0D2JJR6_9EURO|nr:uncharacterized protein Z518_00786 [Rhinocladiella mackenziei CBS 650.93]KIX09705.1 hypothetical protein Z518_00786 [Rhinocladiella mackenziei CBS 650.93]
MVGVPGKSKGCSTCRRRKKGCDQKRPICGQCASSGYVCGGYNRDRTFILHPASKAVEGAIFLPQVKATSISLPGSIDRNAIESQCRSLFWDLYLPQGDCEVRDEFILKCKHPMNWIEVIQNIHQQDASLENAFSALSISRVGQGNRDIRLVRESTKLYGKALKELQLALFDPDRMHSDHVLMACMLLGLYEVFEGPAFNSRSWMAHAQGAARLIQLRGPQRHQNWNAHHPFLASRTPTIYAAILQRKSTYLANEEWLTVPWATQQRTYFDRMVDLATVIPGILEKFDLLRESDSESGQGLMETLEQCRDLQLRMNRWRDGTKTTASPRVIKHASTEQDGYPFDTDLWFENHLFVQARLVYHTSSLALAEVVDDMVGAVQRRDQKLLQSVEPTSLRELFDAEKHAADICRTVRYCLQPEMGALGAHIINFPANLAFTHFQRLGNTAATEWLVTAFQDVKVRGVHVENVFNTFLSKSGDRDNMNYQGKRESSADSTEPGMSPCSCQSLGSTTTTFIYEDPSKSYYDASNDPD